MQIILNDDLNDLAWTDRYRTTALIKYRAFCFRTQTWKINNMNLIVSFLKFWKGQPDSEYEYQ